jgi:branched-chain amino acid transport system substrate-binding protein
MYRIYRDKIKYFIILPVIIISAALALNMISCDSRERIIKIGNQAVLSGAYRAFGEDQLVSLKLAVSRLTPVSIGGFDYTIELVTGDDEGNPEKAFLVARELVDQGIVLAIGSTFDGTTRVSIPVYEEYNIPLLSPFAQKAEIALEGDNFFRVIINNRQKIENMADFILEQSGEGKLILIDNQEEYSAGLVEYLQELLALEGKKIPQPYSIKFGEDDLSVLADNILIDEPDHIFAALDYDELALIIKEVADTGIDPVFMTEAPGMDKRIFDLTPGVNIDGLMAIIPEPPSIAMYTNDQGAIDFWHSYNSLLGDLKDEMDLSIDGPGEYSAYVYDSLILSIEAMKRSNSILPQDFMQELRATSYDGLTGHIEFDSNGNRVDPPSTVFIVRDGAWVRYN